MPESRHLFYLIYPCKGSNKKYFYYFCNMNLGIFKQKAVFSCLLVMGWLLLSSSAKGHLFAAPAPHLTAAGQQPVTFTVQQKKVSATEMELVFKGVIADGWHVYSTGLPAGGPVAATLHIEQAENIQATGALRHQGKEINAFDPTFGMQLRYFEHQVSFIQRFQLKGQQGRVKGYLEYGTCNDKMCMPPESVDFDVKMEGEKPEKGDETEKRDHEIMKSILPDDTSDSSALTSISHSSDSLLYLSSDSLWQPVTAELQAFQQTTSPTGKGWIGIFLMGFIGGLLALLTPCVWPIIPMTVSFFLKRSKDKKKGVRDALLYGLSIIAVFLLLGIVVTAISRPEALNDLATNAWFNLFFFAMLVVFALSLFGWFELSLPSKWADRVDTKATSTGGLLSIFLMAFTLVLVSFSCTAPIVGWLLVEAVTTGSRIGPMLGMLGFALALALPFTLFALFPSWLKQAPKSGSWMNVIKVTLGFLELAFALKFFSVADLAYGWHILGREAFLSLWIAIFLLLGLYLIGVYRFQSDGDRKVMPVPCIMLGLVSIAFAIYMLPGLWGAPCKAVSAFAPPMYTQRFNLNRNEVKAAYTDYETGMAAAREQGKPVLIDFTGYGCVNCRKMEAAVWTEPEIAERLTNDYILISLYVDDKQALPQPLEVTGADGKKKTLRTIGDKWAYLEQHKFGYLAQPFYVALDNNGKPLCGSYNYNEDADAYLRFLNEGLNRYRAAAP